MQRVLVVLLLGAMEAALIASCAGPSRSPGERCLSRADEEYRQCVSPYRPVDEPIDALRREEPMNCRAWHEQARARCYADQPMSFDAGPPADSGSILVPIPPASR